MTILVAVLIASAVQSVPPPPPIIVLPRGSVAEPATDFRSLGELSAAAQEKVKTMDARARDISSVNSQARFKVVQGWRKSLSADPLDARMLARTATEMDALNQGHGIFAGWARLFASLSAADRAILAPHLAASSGRIFIAPTPTAPAPPQNPYAAQQRSEREIAANKVMYDLQQAVYASDPDAELLAAIAEKRRLEEALPAIAHRQPFDVASLKKAYGDLARAIGRENARRSELVIEQLAKLAPDKRALAIERIPYLATPMIAPPPPANRP